MPDVAKVWIRTKVPPGEPGRAVEEHEVHLLLRGPADVYKPNGQLLCAYRPKAIPPDVCEGALRAFEPIRNQVTQNRGIAAGSKRFRPRRKRDGSLSKTVVADPVRSVILGAFDRYPRIPFCRLTAYNANHPDLFREGVLPFLRAVADTYRASVPDRYARQMEWARRTHPAWVIPGTPFTTVTVNHNWRTMLHTDKGDLGSPHGISTIAVIRRGDYSGCWLAFPQYAIGVDLGDGDVLIFDSHEWHANTPMEERSDDVLRVSVVSYFRTKMVECGSPAEELERAKRLRGALDVDGGEPAPGEGYVDPGEPAR